MTVVVDSSLLVAATADSGQAGLWAERIIGRNALAGPHLVLVEAANILRRLESARRLSPFEATSAHRDILRLDLDLFPYQPFEVRIWELRANLTAYDAWYVAVAEALDSPLATLDIRLSRASGPGCPFLTP